MDIIKTRLLSQQLNATQFKTPAEVVGWMAAIQAQDYRMMRWAVAMRMKNPSLAAFEKAYNQGDIVRIHLMRGTWQLVTREDLPYWIALCGKRSAAVIKGWMNANKIIISEEEIQKVRTIMASLMHGRRNVMKAEIAETLQSQGMGMDDHRVSYHIRFAEVEGWICSGDLDKTKPTYCLVEEKIGPLPQVDETEALERLTRKYFMSRGPATMEDYMWWSGLPKTLCQQGLAMIADELNVVYINNDSYYIHNTCRHRGAKKGGVLLLPPFDEYLIGYKSRYHALKPEHTAFAHTNNGIFYPIVAVNGKIVGNWKPTSKDGEITLFEHDVDCCREGLDTAFAQFSLAKKGKAADSKR